jgi:uncharacterized protein (UPF0297 family)
MYDSNKTIEKKLPIKYPIITTYTQHAHLLAILICFESTYDWIFSNYIQLYINKDYKHNWGDFYFPLPYELRPSDTCKWVLSKKVGKDMVSAKWKSILDFVIDAIDSGNYVHTMINYFYVPFGPRFNNQHLHHDILIHGYNLESKIFYVSDFFDMGKYSFEELSFADFEKAYSSNNLTTNQDYLNGLIYMYSIKEECDYTFNINNIINPLKAYLNKSVPEYWSMFNSDNRDHIVFGNEIYDTLINYITESSNNPSSYIDYRPFYLLYDHKKMMLLRMKYLNEKGYFTEHFTSNINKFTELEEQSRVVINQVVKYSISKKNEIISKIVSNLNQIKRMEEDVLGQYIADN